jgi:hypothetical protein
MSGDVPTLPCLELPIFIEIATVVTAWPLGNLHRLVILLKDSCVRMTLKGILPTKLG